MYFFRISFHQLYIQMKYLYWFSIAIPLLSGFLLNGQNEVQRIKDEFKIAQQNFDANGIFLYGERLVSYWEKNKYKPKEFSEVLNTLANFYFLNGSKTIAIQKFSRSIKLLEKHNETRSLQFCVAHHGLGFIASKSFEYQKSKIHFDKSITTFLELPIDTTDMGYLLFASSLAMESYSNDDFDKAAVLFSRGFYPKSLNGIFPQEAITGHFKSYSYSLFKSGRFDEYDKVIGDYLRHLLYNQGMIAPGKVLDLFILKSMEWSIANPTGTIDFVNELIEFYTENYGNDSYYHSVCRMIRGFCFYRAKTKPSEAFIDLSYAYDFFHKDKRLNFGDVDLISCPEFHKGISCLYLGLLYDSFGIRSEYEKLVVETESIANYNYCTKKTLLRFVKAHKEINEFYKTEYTNDEKQEFCSSLTNIFRTSNNEFYKGIAQKLFFCEEKDQSKSSFPQEVELAYINQQAKKSFESGYYDQALSKYLEFLKGIKEYYPEDFLLLAETFQIIGEIYYIKGIESHEKTSEYLSKSLDTYFDLMEKEYFFFSEKQKFEFNQKVAGSIQLYQSLTRDLNNLVPEINLECLKYTLKIKENILNFSRKTREIIYESKNPDQISRLEKILKNRETLATLVSPK